MKGTIKVTKVRSGKKSTRKGASKKTKHTKKATKKSVKKTARKSTKRASTKKKGSKKKPLMHADEAHCFWAHTGAVLSNLRDLERALEEMTDEEFGQHVNAEKNDFANWVEEVLRDKECAKGLRRAKRRMSARTCVTKRLKHYDS